MDIEEGQALATSNQKEGGMSNLGQLHTQKSWSTLLASLNEVMLKWGKRDYILPVFAKAAEDKCVTFRYVVNGKWIELRSGHFERPIDNLAAIVLALDGVRKADQRGLGQLLAAASAVYALPSGKRTPHEVIGVSSQAAQQDVKAAWYSALKRTHPDTGGNAEEFKAVMDAGRKLGFSD